MYVQVRSGSLFKYNISFLTFAANFLSNSLWRTACELLRTRGVELPANIHKIILTKCHSMDLHLDTIVDLQRTVANGMAFVAVLLCFYKSIVTIQMKFCNACEDFGNFVRESGIFRC